MKQAKLVAPISLGSYGEIDAVGTEVSILAEEEGGLMLSLIGVRQLYAIAIPKEGLSEEDLEGVEYLASDLENHFDGVDLEAARPEGTVLILSDNTEVELL